MKQDIKDNIDYKEIGQRIRKRRLELGLTQDQASEKVGITTKYWSNIETNNIESVGLQTLYAIAVALNTNINYLLSDYNEFVVFNEIENIINKMTFEQRTLTINIAKIILEKEEKNE